MQTVEQMIATMIEARKNQQDCPFCNAPCDVAVGGDKHGVRYEHRCECLLYLYLEAEPNEYYDDPDDESSNSSQLNQNQSISEAELIQRDENASATAIAKLMSGYKKKCHKCGRIDGVDSSLPECTEDPPYMFRCWDCKESLRTDRLYGEGKVFDCAKRNITWFFNNQGKPESFNTA